MFASSGPYDLLSSYVGETLDLCSIGRHSLSSRLSVRPILQYLEWLVESVAGLFVCLVTQLCSRPSCLEVALSSSKDL